MSVTGDQLHSLVTNFAHFHAFSSSHLYLVRGDGLILYSSGEKRQGETQSVGALLGGLWQAAEALSGQASLASLKKSTLETAPFHLSFGSSSSGLFALPLTLGGENYFIAVIFNDVTK